MKKLLLKTIKDIKVGSILTVSVAHEYSNGYWNSYTLHDYRVEEVNRKRIIGRNIIHEVEKIEISRKNLDDNYFMIIEVQNDKRSAATEAK